MPIIQHAYKGTFLGHSHPHADEQGYAVDDPPEPAIWRCRCGHEGDPRDFDDEDTCHACAENAQSLRAAGHAG